HRYGVPLLPRWRGAHEAPCAALPDQGLPGDGLLCCDPGVGADPGPFWPMISRRKLLLGCLMAAVVVLLLLALDNRLVVRRYTVESDKLTERVRLAIVSDLHSCAYGKDQKELLDAVAAEEPDLVLLPGDIVDDVLPEDNAWTVL